MKKSFFIIGIVSTLLMSFFFLAEASTNVIDTTSTTNDDNSTENSIEPCDIEEIIKLFRKVMIGVDEQGNTINADIYVTPENEKENSLTKQELIKIMKGENKSKDKEKTNETELFNEKNEFLFCTTKIDFPSCVRDLYEKMNTLSGNALLEYYHSTLSQLFKDAIKYDLQNYENKIDGKSSDQRKLIWNTNLNKYFFLKLYKKKADQISSISKTSKLLPVIPTLALGLEASLHYTLFTCKYKEETLKIIESTDSIDPYSSIDKERRNISENILNARKIMEYSLNSYEALVRAYPQHIAYQTLIERSEILRDEFGDLEDISFNCALKNHYNPSCK